MKKISTFNFQLFILLAALFAAACDKKEEQDPFTGKDSYITAFSLQQDEAVFHAAIAGDVITVTAPESFSLTQAKATVKLSENATIYPDPAEITDWDEEQLFAVTAYNGAQKKYKYTVERSGVAHNGSVVLETQADVDAFGQKGITHLDGNLTIGRATGTDSITSLAPLSNLKDIVYSLTLNNTCAVTRLEGLENLEQVGGTLQIGSGTTTATGLKRLEILSLPALKSAGGISLSNTVTIIIELPELAHVSKLLSLNCPLYQLQLPHLKYAGGAVTMSGSGATIAQISLPALEEAGGTITISSFTEVTKIGLPQLKKSGGLSCSSMAKLSFIYAPMLEEVIGRVYLYGLNNLPEAGFPEMRQAGEVYISSCSALRELNIPKLIRTNNIYLGTVSVDGLAGFPDLQSAGTVSLYNVTKVAKLEFPTSLQHIDYCYIENVSNTSIPAEIDVKGVDIDLLDIRRYSMNTGKIVGSEVFPGILRFQSSGASGISFPPLDGFNEVDSVYIEATAVTSLNIAGIQKINKGLYLNASGANNPYTFDIPDLKEVGTNLTLNITYMTATTMTALEFGNLQSVGGNFTMHVLTNKVDTLRFPALTGVGGSFTLSTGYTSSDFTSVSTLLFPELAAIGGKLTIRATTSGSSSNNKLTHLNGFAKLASVGSVQITRQAALTSYEGFKELFKTLTAEQWILPTYNSYNPTYAQLQAGQWTKP